MKKEIMAFSLDVAGKVIAYVIPLLVFWILISGDLHTINDNLQSINSNLKSINSSIKNMTDALTANDF